MFAIIALVVGTVAILFLLLSVGFSNILDALSKVQISYIVLALAITILGLVIRGARRFIYVSESGCQTNIRTIFTILLSGSFFENVSPARLGEFFVPIALNSRDKIIASSTLSAIIVERTADLAFASIIALLGLLSFNLTSEIQFILFIGIIITLVLIVFILHLTRILAVIVNQAKRVLSFFRKKEPSESDGSLQNLLKTAKTNVNFLLKSKRGTIFGITLTGLLWSLNGIRLLVVMKSVGLEIPWPQATVVVVFTILLALASMVPFGHGTAEFAMVFILTSMGFPLVLATVVAIIDRFLAVWLVILIGLVASLRLNQFNSQNRGDEHIGRRIKIE